MRSDSVMNVSAVCPLPLHAELCVNVCVPLCVCVLHPFSVWSWASACVVRLLSGHGWSPQRVVRLADCRSCLHCISVPSEEEQTPCRLQPPHQTVITHTNAHTPLFPMLWQALLLCRHTPALAPWQAHFPDRSMVFLTS